MIPPLSFDPAGALCAEVGGDWFFPEAGDSTSAAAAKRICAKCPLVDPCRAYALAHVELQGIWGGTTDRQRRYLRAGYVPLPPRRRPEPKVEDGACVKRPGVTRRTHTCPLPIPCHACVHAERLYQRAKKQRYRQERAS